MCGRTAYSAQAITAAAEALEGGNKSSSKDATESFADGKSTQSRIIQLIQGEVTNRPNAGPGSSMHIFRRSRNCKEENDLELCKGIWGLIPNDGTHHSPHLLPSDPKFSTSPHYTMFNARSETIYEKRSFRGLIRNGQTCILAVDGYYEWTKSTSSADKKRQPYFVCNKNKERPLLLAGLWSCIKTGRQTMEKKQAETLITFTILTMDANPGLSWVHPRQPVVLWNTSLALEWLMQPTPLTLEKLHSAAIEDKMTEQKRKLESICETELLVYPVSKMINDGKYQGMDCTSEVKLLETTAPSLKSYFSPKKEAKTETIPDGNSDQKLPPTPTRSSSLEPKGSILEQQSHSTLDVAYNETSYDDESRWVCSKCTFIHGGSKKLNYLACEVCGSPRIRSEAVDDGDGGRKRKTMQ